MHETVFFESFDEEQVVTPNNAREWIDWISDHDQAFKDLVQFMSREDPEWDPDETAEVNLSYQSAGDLDDWLADHETLRNDWISYAERKGLLD